MQDEPHLVRVDDDDLFDLVLQLRSLGALETEHDVLGRERVAVVEFQPFAQGKFIFQLVLALGPGFGEAGCHAASRHRLHQRVVQRDQHPERRDEARLGLPRIEPARRQRHIDGEPHLAFRLGLRRRRARPAQHHAQRKDRGRGKLPPSLHRRFVLPTAH